MNGDPGSTGPEVVTGASEVGEVEEVGAVVVVSAAGAAVVIVGSAVLSPHAAPTTTTSIATITRRLTSES
jgi:hypothetical protein